MLLVNRQMYHEAREIIYSKNHFMFRKPEDLLRFVEEIGIENQNYIRSIRFPVNCTPKRPHIDPNKVLGIEPHYWTDVLLKSNLENVVEMYVCNEIFRETGLLSGVIDPAFEAAIKHMLGYCLGKNSTPKLILSGFFPFEYEKFPQQWRIIMYI